MLPTGTGKSVLFADLARRISPGRTLFIAHRRELVRQAADHLRNAGLTVDVEMADESATTTFWNRSGAIVSSVQSLCSGGTCEVKQHCVVG